MSKRKVKTTVYGTVCDLCNRLMYTPDEPITADDTTYIHINKHDFHTKCIEKAIAPLIRVKPL